MFPPGKRCQHPALRSMFFAVVTNIKGGGLIAITYIRQAPSDVPGDATIFDCDGDQVHKEKGLAIQRGDTLHVSEVWSDGYYLVSVSR